MKLIFEIEDRFYKLAEEWLNIEAAIKNEGYEKLPQSERFRIVEKASGAWKDFIKRHKLMIREKPLRILGVKEPMWSVKNKEELDRAIMLLRILIKEKEG